MLVVATAIAAACSPTAPPTPPAAVVSGGPSQSGATGSSAAASPSAPQSPSALPSGSGPASLGLASAAAVLADPGLLGLVPTAGSGLTLTYDPDTTATVAADPRLAADAAALATGLAVPTGQSSPAEFVIVNVVRLRDAAKDADWFRSWRDTYDTGACQQAGGVSGHSEFEANGRTVFVGACVGGAFTYHVRLSNGEIVVSLTSIGASRDGERIMRALP